AEKKLLYREFRTTTDWERVFWSDLSTELTRRALQERAVDEPQGSSAESESGAGEAATASGEAAYPEVERGGEALSRLHAAAVALADKLTGESAGSLGDDALTIVRINLLTAAALSQSRANEAGGPHDVNLACRHRALIELVDGDPP